MIKLFVTDLDGTLLGQENYIDEKDKQALAELVQNGVELAVASGRMDREIVKVLKLVGQTGHRISQNGGFVYDRNDNLVHSETFKPELSKRLYDAITKNDFNHTVSTADEIYVPHKTEQMKLLEEILFFPIIETPNLAHQFNESIVPSKFSLLGETEDLLKIKEELNGQFTGEMESYLSDKHCVDMVPKGISKALGLNHLLENIKVSPEEMACIGDSFNDIPMLEMTPNSYAMASAHPEVKNSASHVVEHVYEAVDHLERTN